MKGKKLVVGITGASGAPYARVLLEALCEARARGEVELGVVLSRTASEVWRLEVGGELGEWLRARELPVFAGRDYAAPFASGSAGWGAMVIAPCSMSTCAKIAHGLSDDLLTRAADVMLKERRALVLVPRETPLSTIHLENLLALARAGAIVLPAMPSFYGEARSVDALVGTVVARALDHLGIEHRLAKRWGEGDS